METFNHKLMGILYKSEDNYVISSFSILNVLNIVCYGCSEDDKTEMLRNTMNADSWFMDAISSLTEYFTGKTDGVISLRNAIFYDKCKRLKDELYEGLHKSTDFKSVSMLDPVTTSLIMNKWVENHSKGTITQAFNNDDFGCSINHTYILNVMVFNGKWIRPFRVTKGEFHIDNDKVVECNMLYCEDAYLYVHELSDGIFAVKIPMDDDYDFMITVGCTPEVANEHRIESANFIYKRIDFYMPKFSFEYDWNVNRVLNRIGFEEWLASDYELFENGRSARINNIHQKTKFSVTEEGVEATSLTVADCVDGPSKSILVNRPYIFSVYKKGICFFSGRCVNPIKE